MDVDVDFRTLPWAERPDPVASCPYAEGFAAYCAVLLTSLARVKPANLEVAIAEVKRELLDRYMDFLTDTPPGHANAAGRKKHRCIVDVLNDTAREIRWRERSLPPPKLAARRETTEEQASRQSWVEELTTRLTTP